MFYSRLRTCGMTGIGDDCNIIWSRKEKGYYHNNIFLSKVNHADVEPGRLRERHLTSTHVCLVVVLISPSVLRG